MMGLFGDPRKRQLVSYPMVMTAFGVLVYHLPLNLPDPDPIAQEMFILRLCELAVIISLMGTGLKISKVFSFRNYRIPLLMALVTMIGCIVSVAVAGWWLAGLVPASAMLLGAVFAPTDPVIANDVQVDFKDRKEHPVKFILTAEAGINDGMAFPFTWLAVWMASAGLEDMSWVMDWVASDLLYRILAAVAVGIAVGRLMIFFLFRIPLNKKISVVREEFIVVATTLLVYGLTEAIHGYGFIAVFVAGVTLRNFDREHEFHRQMHTFIEQFEKMLLAIVLFFLGGYVTTYLFQFLQWEHVLLVFLFLIIIRPLFGILPLIGTDLTLKKRAIIGFMGMKGVGSLFYLAFALKESAFAQPRQLWAATAFLVFVSVVIHGSVAFLIRSDLEKDSKK